MTITTVAEPALVRGPLFSVVKTFDLDAVYGEETKKCLRGWQYAKENLIKRLPDDQSGASARVVTTLVSRESATFVKWAGAILDVPADISTHRIEWLLRGRGHTMCFPQIKKMTKATEDGEDTGINIEGKISHFFVENREGGVSVGTFYRKKDHWVTAIIPFNNIDNWRPGRILLVCNLDLGIPNPGN